MAMLARPTPRTGFFVPNPTTGPGCQGCRTLDLGRGVHRCPPASVVGRGGSYSVGYSAPARSAGGWSVSRARILQEFEGVAPLPRRIAHGFVSHDHTVPAVTVKLTDGSLVGGSAFVFAARDVGRYRIGAWADGSRCSLARV